MMPFCFTSAGVQAEDGRRGQHPDQAGVQGVGAREEHPHRGERRLQRHTQTAGRNARPGKAIQGRRGKNNKEVKFSTILVRNELE